MQRPFIIIWITLFIAFFVPSPVSKFILDITGGFILFIILLPLIVSGIGWIGWKIIKSKLKDCSKCGASFSADLTQCPLCGSIENETNLNIPASSATIDIIAEEAE